MKTTTLKLITLSLFLLVTLHHAAAQVSTTRYNNAVGLRAGTTAGITYKHRFDKDAVEGILGLWGNGISITGLYELYAGSGVSGLNWYYGAGGHVALHTGYYYTNHDLDHSYYRRDGFAIGVDGIVGIEYKIAAIPFALSFDLKPFVQINSRGSVSTALDPGLGIKFAF